MFNETTGMNLTIVTNATVDEWELIMSHVQYVRLTGLIISFFFKTLSKIQCLYPYLFLHIYDYFLSSIYLCFR